MTVNPKSRRYDDALERGWDGTPVDPPTSAEMAEWAALPDDDPWKTGLAEAERRATTDLEETA